MAIINGFNLIRALTAWHLLIGYFLLTSPETLADQSFIFIMGESMGLPHPKTSFHLNPLATNILGVMFIFLGLSDFVALNSKDELARGYWDVHAPFRLCFFFALTTYTYLFRPKRGVVRAGTGEPLKNSLVFSWGFLEIIMWFWIYTNLREERAVVDRRLMEQKMHREARELERDD
ncbi:hypothetical protein RUND412_003943 [Rhizina undulata]